MATAGLAIGSQRFELLAARLVEQGRFASISEVLEAAVDALEREECEDEAKAEALDEAIAAGFASGIYDGDPFADARAKYGLAPSTR